MEGGRRRWDEGRERERRQRRGRGKDIDAEERRQPSREEGRDRQVKRRKK